MTATSQQAHPTNNPPRDIADIPNTGAPPFGKIPEHYIHILLLRETRGM
jgi:hypothetical protein